MLLMRLRVAAAASALLIAFSPLVLSAQGNENAARAKVLALEHVRNLAETSADLKALDSLFDHDLIYIDADGSLLTKTEVLAQVKSVPIQQFVTEQMTVQVFDDTAVVNGTYRTSEFRNGKLIVFRGRFTDIWMYKDSNWICIAAQETPITSQGTN